MDFPAPPPPEGWSAQTLHFLAAIATVDLLGALLALVFVIGYLRGSRWWLGLGVVVLTVSLHAAAIFNYGTWSAGAWTGANFWMFAAINVLFLPILPLAALTYSWSLAQMSTNCRAEQGVAR